VLRTEFEISLITQSSELSPEGLNYVDAEKDKISEAAKRKEERRSLSGEYAQLW
jgi:hypothetical protein